MSVSNTNSTTDGTSGVIARDAATANTSKTDSISTDKDTFLKLLVAQLKNQDPMSPVEDKEFIAQLAQFTSVEKLENIDKTLTSNTTSVSAQSAMGVVGKTVTVLDPDSKSATPVTGKVTATQLLGSDDGPMVTIGSKQYPASWITNVYNDTQTAAAQQALGLVGKTVTVKDPSSDKAQPVTGEVTSTQIQGNTDGTVITIGGKQYPVSWVTNVFSAPQTTAAN